MPVMPTSGNIPEAIRLQLRKPRSWRWELSTSKSSPHIVLPVIQLYDYKGQLLVETADSGDAKRKTWQSSAAPPNGKNKENVRRSRSDALDVDFPKDPRRENAQNVTLTNGADRSRGRNNSCRSSQESGRYWRRKSVVDPPALTGLIPGKDVIREDAETDDGCASDRTEECPGGKGNLSHRREVKNVESLVGKLERNESQQPRRHRRAKSDDLYRRKLRYNSSDESMKRAEKDGYRKFISAYKSEDELQGNPRKTKNIGKNGMTIATLEDNRRPLEVTHMNQKEYTTRTSSAGTLIIPEDSFRDIHNKRNRMTGIVEEKYVDELPPAKTTKKLPNHKRQMSDPTVSARMSRESLEINRFKCEHPCKQIALLKKQRHYCPGTELFYSRSDVFPFEKPPDNGSHFDENHNNRMDGSDSDEWNFQAIMEKSRRRKRRRRGRKRGNVEGHLITDHPARLARPADAAAPRPSPPAPDARPMGANVSRPSAKGLSGRRSRSSGSLCEGGKAAAGRPEGKICGSLPGFLDETPGKGGRQEEPAADEVDRLSSFGDGAPFHWKFSEVAGHPLCDQGYGSERSPEDEYPPPLPDHDRPHICHRHLEPHQCYPFITPESTFVVKLSKGPRGLGLSVTGGIDGGGHWPGLVRVKRLFPHQPASACGALCVGDLLLEVNGVALTGLTNYEALEVLRKAPSQVDLKVCRPPPDVLNCVSPISEVPPPPPRREPPNSLNLPTNTYNTPEDEYYHGEFEVTLNKIQGSLGFTLRKEDDSALGHYVRALVREPALTDGRIRAGDKIIAVNDVEICPMTHEQAVQFLRSCPDVVKLRLYRDAAQTPVATLSPSETTPRGSFSRKANLRQEAVDMLNDIAGRKMVDATREPHDRSPSPGASPRRSRRLCPSDGAPRRDVDQFHEQFHEALLQKCSQHPFDEQAFDSLFISEGDDGDRPLRPASLDLYNPNQTPVACRKPRFNFSLAHNAYELNNLDAEVLDAPNLTYNLDKSTEPEVKEPVSMPHIPTNNPTFSYKNPAYQSAHPQMGSEPNEPLKVPPKVTEDGTLKRRKSSSSREEKDASQRSRRVPMKEEYEVLAIELNRGWNSRLGFSLQGAAGVTYVSAVHADSVAAKDGRLKPGDRLIKVNDESIEHMSTSEIIELLRIVRGPVCVVVSRVKPNE